MYALILTLVLSLASTFSQANTKNSEELLKEATALFEQRADLKMNDQAVAVLEEALSKSEANSNTKFQILVLASRALYWKASHEATKENKMKFFEAGMSKADIARKEKPDLAEGYYFYGISLARWAEAKGVMESLGRKKELMDSMEAAQARETADGSEGSLIDGNGPDRVLGRVYFKLPGFAGGSRETSVKFLRTAVEAAPLWPLNLVYLAESLHKGNNQEKAEACELLKTVSETNYDELNKDAQRAPENKEEVADGLKLKSELCDKRK